MRAALRAARTRSLWRRKGWLTRRLQRAEERTWDDETGERIRPLPASTLTRAMLYRVDLLLERAGELRAPLGGRPRRRP